MIDLLGTYVGKLLLHELFRTQEILSIENQPQQLAQWSIKQVFVSDLEILYSYWGITIT